jgi:hypothetical protein
MSKKVTVADLIATLKNFPMTTTVDVEKINVLGIDTDGVISIQLNQSASENISEKEDDEFAENVAAIRKEIADRVLAELDDVAFGVEETPDINAVLDFLISYVYQDDVFEFTREVLLHGYESIEGIVNDIDEDTLFELYDYMNDE